MQTTTDDHRVVAPQAPPPAGATGRLLVLADLTEAELHVTTTEQERLS